MWLQRESGVDLSDIYVWRMVKIWTEAESIAPSVSPTVTAVANKKFLYGAYITSLIISQRAKSGEH